MIVRDVMTPEPYVAEVRDSIRTVLLGLAEADVRHLPVVDDGVLVGIVSDRDLRGLFAPERERDEITAETVLAQPISALMSTNLVSIDPEAELSEAVDLMIEHKVGAIPVLEARSSRLLGIVSYVDVLRAARDLL